MDATEHDADLAGRGAGERRDRGEPLPGAVLVVDEVVAQPACRVGQDRRSAQRAEPLLVGIDALGLLLCVGEDGVVNRLVEPAVGTLYVFYLILALGLLSDPLR